jgi:hypothetical protein
MVRSVCSRRPRSCGQHRRGRAPTVPLVDDGERTSFRCARSPPSGPCRFLAPGTSRLAELSEASARLAAYALHAQRDSRETTANGRAAFLARFDREVDPEGLLEPDERRRRAEQARRAYFARLSLAAVKARQAKRAARAQQKEDGTAA